MDGGEKSTVYQCRTLHKVMDETMHKKCWLSM